MKEVIHEVWVTFTIVPNPGKMVRTILLPLSKILSFKEHKDWIAITMDNGSEIIVQETIQGICRTLDEIKKTTLV